MGLTFTCKYAKSYSIINSIQQPLAAASFNMQFQSKANKEIWYVVQGVVNGTLGPTSVTMKSTFYLMGHQ